MKRIKPRTVIKYAIPVLTVGAVIFAGYTLLIAPALTPTKPAAVIGNSQGCTIAYLPKIKKYTAPPSFCINKNKIYLADVETNMGDISIKLLPKEAPDTVNSFVFLSKSGFYDNLTFHRVIPSFVIQGGDPLGNGQGGSGYTFPDEINAQAIGLSSSEIKNYESQGYAYTAGLQTEHITTGVVAMANSGANTNGSQFFITLTAQPSLDGLYTPFGEVVSGMDTANKIANVSTDTGNKPLTPVVIKHIAITEEN